MTTQAPETPIIDAINDGVEISQTLDALNAPAVEHPPIEVQHRARFKHTLFIEIGNNASSVLHRVAGQVCGLLTQVNWTAVLVAAVGLLTVWLMKG